MTRSRVYSTALRARGSHSKHQRSRLGTDALSQKSTNPVLERFLVTEAHWIVEARAGIASLPLGRASVNIAVRAKNPLGMDHVIDFAPQVINRAGQFINGRTAGVDLFIAP